MSMNTYGHQAMALWKEWAPEAYSKIENPTMFFTQLGEDALEQMSDYMDGFLREMYDPNETDTLKLWAKTNTAKSMAEAQIRSEMLMPPTIEVGDDGPDDEVMLSDLMPGLEPGWLTMDKELLASKIEDLYAEMDMDSPLKDDLTGYTVTQLEIMRDRAQEAEREHYRLQENRTD